MGDEGVEVRATRGAIDERADGGAELWHSYILATRPRARVGVRGSSSHFSPHSALTLPLDGKTCCCQCTGEPKSNGSSRYGAGDQLCVIFTMKVVAGVMLGSAWWRSWESATGRVAGNPNTASR